MLKQTIEESIKEYNRYRSPEITSRLIAIGGQSFNIEFTGSFCYSCGFFDYFDDYKILLEEKGLATSINEIVEIYKGAHVNFKII